MHVLVLGAGVIGMTTAYYLAERGCRVTVLDRGNEAANGASHANGGQLSYSFTDSLARPSFIRQIPRLLAGLDPASRIRVSAGLFGWGSRFLAQCTSARSRHNTLALLETALRSAELMAELRGSLDLEFAHRPAGKLVLLESDEEIASAQDTSRLKAEHGSDTVVLSRDAALELGLFGERRSRGCARVHAQPATSPGRQRTGRVSARCRLPAAAYPPRSRRRRAL